MNSWANVGDLVFILSRDNEPVPCKVIKEIGIGKDIQLFFEPIIAEDKNKIPKIRLKAFLSQVGYNGGFVFKEKQNALDYLELIKTNGSFNMSSIIAKKTKRAQEKMQRTQHQLIDVNKIKQEAAQEAVDYVHKVVIAAMLLAINSKLGVGAKRGAEITEEINRLIETKDREELLNEAETKMKIKLR